MASRACGIEGSIDGRASHIVRDSLPWAISALAYQTLLVILHGSETVKRPQEQPGKSMMMFQS